MKPIEAYPDKKHCELCGAMLTNDGVDPIGEHSAVEVVRRLAFIADSSPSLALLMVHRIAGRTEREIAAKTRRSQSDIHRQIVKSASIIESIRK